LALRYGPEYDARMPIQSALGRGGLRVQAVALAATLVAAAGCSSDGPAAPANTGRLTVAVSGVPAGTNAAVQISGPGNYFQLVPVTRTFAELAPGTYQVTATELTVSGTKYRPTPPSQSVSVVNGSTESATVVYAP
jgi:hypothetical protein